MNRDINHKGTKTQRVPSLRFPEFEGEWEVKLLGDISQIRTGPFGAQLHQEDYVESDGTPIITVEHLGTHGIRHKNLPLGIL